MYYREMIPLEDLRLGMNVRFFDYSVDREGIIGKVVDLGVDPNGSEIVFLKLPEPIPALLLNFKIFSEELAYFFFPDNEIKVIGGQTLAAMDTKGIEVPSGRIVKSAYNDRYVYLLDKPLPISYLESFCNEHYPGEAACVKQSLFLDVLPLRPEYRWRKPGEHAWMRGFFSAI